MILESMNTVLVAYASKHGSTAEIAEVIADKMRESGLEVDCMPVRDVESLERYDAVVLGSALYLNHWRTDATRFLREQAEGLAERPLWVFSSGPVGEASTALEPKRIVAEIERLGAREHVVFGGRLPSEAHGPFEQVLVRKTPTQYRDRRYWAEIRAWAARIAEAIVTLEPVGPPRSG